MLLRALSAPRQFQGDKQDPVSVCSRTHDLKVAYIG